MSPSFEERIEVSPADLPATLTGFEDPPSETMAAGIEAFNAGRFFEAHEYFEETWIPEEGPLAHFYQGLVMIAAGFHHLTSRVELPGVKRLLGTGIEQVEPFAPACQGLDVARLVAETAAARELALELGQARLATFPGDRIPTIHMAGEST